VLKFFYIAKNFDLFYNFFFKFCFVNQETYLCLLPMVKIGKSAKYRQVLLFYEIFK